jgi:hypothetical protein
MQISIERKLARKTPVYDHADSWLYDADRDQARDLMRRRDVDVIGTATRVKALRFRGPDPALQLSGSRRRRGIAEPHRNENYYNVRGVWTIDRVPEVYRPHFHAVLTDCLRKAA